MPLVSGVSHIKWHLPHSIHGEHRGRTAKCPIANHRVEYNYGRIVPIRIAIDRNGNLAECAIEFEVLQEFQIGGTGRDEKIVLGKVMLNLSEYVEESEAILRDIRPGTAGSRRKRSSFSTSGGGTATGGDYEEEEEVEEGVVRRYLMQESKVNSTLKIGVLMMQVDGERNFSAPPLKTAPVFGGIAGIMAGEQVEPTQDEGQPLPPTSSKSRDASELQDMYRRALAASWACQPGEMQADECIEDIFSGGDGSQQVGDAEGSGARTPLGNNTPHTAPPPDTLEHIPRRTLRPRRQLPPVVMTFWTWEAHSAPRTCGPFYATHGITAAPVTAASVPLQGATRARVIGNRREKTIPEGSLGPGARA